jgi:hypothetical protein
LSTFFPNDEISPNLVALVGCCRLAFFIILALRTLPELFLLFCSHPVFLLFPRYENEIRKYLTRMRFFSRQAAEIQELPVKNSFERLPN